MDIIKKVDYFLAEDKNLGILATSGTLKGIKKLIEAFYFSKVTLKEKGKDEWEIYNKNGIIDRTFVRKVGKQFRFEDVKNKI